MAMREFEGSGCILADDMARGQHLRCRTALWQHAHSCAMLWRTQGLGKTLQAIALLWTLLRQGKDGQPIAKRVIIVCPTSLVSNWCAPSGFIHLLAGVRPRC